MTIEDAKNKLYDTTFLVGTFRRRAAIQILSESTDPTNTVLLSKALAKNHPNSAFILSMLQRLSPDRDSDKVVALWMAWGKAPQPMLAGILARLGWPSVHVPETKMVREIFELATVRAAPEVLRAIGVLARSLPITDETWNDAIYVAWIHSQSEEIEQVITEQGRQPGSPPLEALHALVTGAVNRYTALADEDGTILAQAFSMAPSSFRDRMARSVARSTDRQLKEMYRLALPGNFMDDEKVIANLKLMRDEDGLFEKTRSLRLGTTLELCNYWATNPGRPSRPKSRAIVDQVVAVYRTLNKFQEEPVPNLPDGCMDLFDYWHQQQPINAELEADLLAKDPVRRARGVYLGRNRRLINRQRLRAAARSEHWLERLAMRLIDPATLAKAKADHVLWVSLCTGEGATFQTPIAGTPEDYHRHNQLLRQTQGTRARALLEILCIFQESFVASGIIIDEINEGIDPNAIEIEGADEEF